MNSSHECIIQFKWHWLSGALCFPLLLAECVKSLLFLFILTWSLFSGMAWACWRYHHSTICFLDRWFLADVLRGSTQITNLFQKLKTKKPLISQPNAGHNPYVNNCMSRKSAVRTFIMAVVASVFKVGWCLISSSTALPKLDAVSPGDIVSKRWKTSYKEIRKNHLLTIIPLKHSKLQCAVTSPFTTA